MQHLQTRAFASRLFFFFCLCRFVARHLLPTQQSPSLELVSTIVSGISTTSTQASTIPTQSLSFFPPLARIQNALSVQKKNYHFRSTVYFTSCTPHPGPATILILACRKARAPPINSSTPFWPLLPRSIPWSTLTDPRRLLDSRTTRSTRACQYLSLLPQSQPT